MNKNTFYLLLLLSICFFTQSAFSQTTTQEKHAKIKIYTGENGLKELAALGLAVDHGIRKKGSFFIGDFSESEISVVKKAGFSYDILQNDLTKYYVERNLKATTATEKATASTPCKTFAEYPIPEGFNYGSMGGFLTYEELMAELDSMATEYGDLITKRTAIDTFKTHEGRSIHWLKISDNPNEEETEEPQILYTGLHHAREPMSMTQMIYYMHYLLENYGKDEDITYLVDNTEMYFVPCLNPDGYVYNQQTNPNGGGLWRKNKRDNNENGTFESGVDGVDLNRNYGLEWAYDNIGSSPDMSRATYRGPSAFSEPETQAIKYFCETHNFLFALNYHSYSNLLIYPWGYIGSFLTPDSTLFEQHADLMTEENNYLAGTGDQTVGYLVNGDSDDWMYGEQETKNKILALTPEVGSGDDGFWPRKDRIIPLCQENMLQNLMTARLVHQYANTEESSPIYVQNQEANINISLAQLGLKSGTGFDVSIEPVNDAIAGVGNGTFIFSPALLGTAITSLPFQLKDDITTGEEIVFNINVANEDGMVSTQTVSKYFGRPTLTYENDASSVLTWEQSTGSGNDWGLTTTDFTSPPTCLTDSPQGYYRSNTRSRTTLVDIIDLTDCKHAVLKFWAKWDVEANFDYVQIEAKEAQSGTVTPLCGRYTHSGAQTEDKGAPLYDGTQAEWVQEEVDLADFVGQKINLRLFLSSDGFMEGDGFFIDDIEIHQLLNDEAVNVEIITSEKQLQLGQNQPNPVTDQTNISYQLPQEPIKESLQLLIVNTLGQVIHSQTLPKDNIQGQISIDTQAFDNGVYYYYLAEKNRKSTIRKMAVMH